MLMFLVGFYVAGALATALIMWGLADPLPFIWARCLLAGLMWPLLIAYIVVFAWADAQA